MALETVTLTTPDDLRLEGRLAVPDTAPAGAAVICHPHPAYQGSMSSALVPVIQRALARAGYLTLRFNFRGVGRSEGSYSGGPGEILDATTALTFVADRLPGAPLSLVGWSFGAIVGLHAATADARVGTFAAVAPPVSIAAHIEMPRDPDPAILASWPSRVLVACGTEDPFCHPNAARAWAATLSARAEVRIFDGADHFFTGRAEEIADAVAGFVAG